MQRRQMDLLIGTRTARPASDNRSLVTPLIMSLEMELE